MSRLIDETVLGYCFLFLSIALRILKPVINPITKWFNNTENRFQGMRASMRSDGEIRAVSPVQDAESPSRREKTVNKTGLVERMCAYNRAISDPNRMKMIKILGSHPRESLNVGDIADLLGISQPAATKHLRLMEEAGIFGRHRKGTSVYYSLNEEALAEYREELENAFAHAYTPCINEYDCETCPARDTCV